MSKSVWVRRDIGGRTVAVPANQESREILNTFPLGKEFIAETHGARNIKQLNLFWALMQMVADNDPGISDRYQARDCLMLELNYIRVVYDRKGKSHIMPQSIACESMTQEEFNPFFQQAVDTVHRWLGIAPAEIRKKLDEMTNPTKGYTIK